MSEKVAKSLTAHELFRLKQQIRHERDRYVLQAETAYERLNSGKDVWGADFPVALTKRELSPQAGYILSQAYPNALSLLEKSLPKLPPKEQKNQGKYVLTKKQYNLLKEAAWDTAEEQALNAYNEIAKDLEPNDATAGKQLPCEAAYRSFDNERERISFQYKLKQVKRRYEDFTYYRWGNYRRVPEGQQYERLKERGTEQFCTHLHDYKNALEHESRYYLDQKRDNRTSEQIVPSSLLFYSEDALSQLDSLPAEELEALLDLVPKAMHKLQTGLPYAATLDSNQLQAEMNTAWSYAADGLELSESAKRFIDGQRTVFMQETLSMFREAVVSEQMDQRAQRQTDMARFRLGGSYLQNLRDDLRSYRKKDAIDLLKNNHNWVGKRYRKALEQMQRNLTEQEYSDFLGIILDSAQALSVDIKTPHITEARFFEKGQEAFDKSFDAYRRDFSKSHLAGTLEAAKEGLAQGYHSLIERLWNERKKQYLQGKSSPGLE